MTKRETYRARLQETDPAALEPLLLEHSGLPGRRANLELAAALGDWLLADPPSEVLWQQLEGWIALGADRAPTNARREYLPFCAAQALGACHVTAEPLRRSWIEARLRAAASDARWRLREAACFGLQRIGEQDPDVLLGLLRGWLPDVTLTERRAMLTTLAHPPLLERADVVELALELADEALGVLEALEGEEARSDEARVLRKCLEFAPSVYAAADPGRGFALLRRWAGQESVPVKKIVVANLRKARLARCFPDEIEGVVSVLSFAD